MKKKDSLLRYTWKFYTGQLTPAELKKNSGIRPYANALVKNPKSRAEIIKRGDRFEQKQYAALTYFQRKIRKRLAK